MDEISRATATAALMLQSATLQALVLEGVLTPQQGLDIVEKAIASVLGGQANGEGKVVAEAARSSLEGVREVLAETIGGG